MISIDLGISLSKSFLQILLSPDYPHIGIANQYAVSHLLRLIYDLTGLEGK
jgi:hypothetical protein